MMCAWEVVMSVVLPSDEELESLEGGH